MASYHLTMWSPARGVMTQDLPPSDDQGYDLLEWIDRAGRLALSLSGRTHRPVIPPCEDISDCAERPPRPERGKRLAARRLLKQAEDLFNEAGEQHAARQTHRLRDALDRDATPYRGRTAIMRAP